MQSVLNEFVSFEDTRFVDVSANEFASSMSEDDFEDTYYITDAAGQNICISTYG